MQPNGMNSLNHGFHLLQQFNEQFDKQGQNALDENALGQIAQHFAPAYEVYAPADPHYQDMAASASTAHIPAINPQVEAPLKQASAQILPKPTNTQHRQIVSAYSAAQDVTFEPPTAKETQEFQMLTGKAAESTGKAKAKAKNLVSIPDHLRRPNESSLKRISPKNLELRKPVHLTKELLYTGEKIGKVVSKKEFKKREMQYKKLMKALERNSGADNVNIVSQKNVEKSPSRSPGVGSSNAPVAQVQMPSEFNAFENFMSGFEGSAFNSDNTGALNILDMQAEAPFPQFNVSLHQEPSLEQHDSATTSGQGADLFQHAMRLFEQSNTLRSALPEVASNLEREGQNILNSLAVPALDNVSMNSNIPLDNMDVPTATEYAYPSQVIEAQHNGTYVAPPAAHAPLSSEYLQHVSNVAAGLPSIEPQAKFVQTAAPTLMQNTQIVEVNAQQAQTSMAHNTDQGVLGFNLQPRHLQELAMRHLVPGLPNGYQQMLNLSRQRIAGPGY